MKIFKNQSWYEIKENNKILNHYPIKTKRLARVAINIAKSENIDINLAIDIARDRINFFR